MTFDVAYLRKTLKDILAELLTGVVVSGGTVDVAVANNQNTYLQQWIQLESGSASAVSVNLIGSVLEPFNLYASTAFYFGITSTNANALNDVLTSRVPGTTAYLPGFINPQHLRLEAHFDSCANILTQAAAVNIPVFNTATGAWSFNAVNNLNGNIGLTNLFTGGTPSVSSTGTGAAANVFDSDGGTSWHAAANTDSWVQYDLGVGNARYIPSFYARVASAFNTETFYVEGSNDATNWTKLTGNSSIANASGTLDMNLTNLYTSTAFRYYRLHYTAVSGSFLTIYSFFGYSTVTGVSLDTVHYVFGNGSFVFGGYGYLSGTAVTNAALQLSNNDWHFRTFAKFASSPGTMGLLAIVGKELEILVTSTGLRVNYSIDGTNFVTVNSSAISWNTGVNYFISVRRTGNTLYFFVDGIAKGTADLTGVTFFNTVTNAFNLGADVTGANPFIGNIDSVEMLVGESLTDTTPVAPRSGAYIPAVNWTSLAGYVASDIKNLDILFFLDEKTFLSFGVPIVNSDLVFSVSLDNGSTWHPVTLTKVGLLTSNTSIYKGTLDATGITNTNQLTYKIVSAAGKVVKYDGAVISWS